MAISAKSYLRVKEKHIEQLEKEFLKLKGKDKASYLREIKACKRTLALLKLFST